MLFSAPVLVMLALVGFLTPRSLGNPENVPGRPKAKQLRKVQFSIPSTMPSSEPASTVLGTYQSGHPQISKARMPDEVGAKDNQDSRPDFPNDPHYMAPGSGVYLILTVVVIFSAIGVAVYLVSVDNGETELD